MISLSKKLFQFLIVIFFCLFVVGVIYSCTVYNADIIISKIHAYTVHKRVNSSEATANVSLVTLKDESNMVAGDLFESGFKIVNADLCPNEGHNIKLLVLIASAPNHELNRMAIRKTWGHYRQRKDISIGFVIGSTNSTQDKLEIESGMYGDIIQGKYVDSYKNLTFKSISTFEWMDKYCSAASFLLKCDDDMFINIDKLLELTEKLANAEKSIFGRMYKKVTPIRDVSDKYYVSYDEYPHEYYPDYTIGAAYLVTKDVIRDLHRTALVTPFFKLDDIFITGMVAQKLNIERILVDDFKNYVTYFQTCPIRSTLSIHDIAPHLMFDLWAKFNDHRQNCSGRH